MSQLGPGAQAWKPGIFDADALGVTEAMGNKVAAIVSAAISRMRFIATPYRPPFLLLVCRSFTLATLLNCKLEWVAASKKG